MSRLSAFGSKLRRALAVGPRGIAQRAAQRAYRATGAADLLFNLDLDDLLTDVPGELPLPAGRPSRSAGIGVGWVMTPPAPGSGGHTTLFRMIEALEDRGHTCVLYMYDKHGLDADRLTAVVRAHWPRIRAEVKDVRAGIAGVDAVVATSWESAHLIVKYTREPVRRLYFIQDYEPYFYGHGAEHEFAAMTYTLPFRRVALGEMLDGMIERETGLRSDVIPFGADSTAYRLPSVPKRRSGIVFYCRPDFPRRGYQLAAAALIRFHQAHPRQEIHIYGAAPRGLQIPFTFHGRLAPEQLNALYGRTIAGLAMSFTNITLVAEEMLAAGNIPIVNEMELAHRVLTNPYVLWAPPTASGLADALSKAVANPAIDATSAAAAAAVNGRSWVPSQEALVRIVEEEVYGQ